jgi:dTDP-4-amino-4,6-dideoxygalactose transaminase
LPQLLVAAIDFSHLTELAVMTLELLFKKKILSPVRYGMHMQPIFASYPYYGNNAESLFENGLCLPSGSNLTDSDR